MSNFIRILGAAVLLTAGCMFVASAAEKNKLDERPAGLSATTITLADLLAAHGKAIGRLPAGTVNSAKEEWAFTDSGTSGTVSLLRSGTDYRSKIVTTPFTELYGQLHGKRWYQNRNGLTTASQEKEERSFYTERVLEDAADPKNDASVLGETTGPDASYVVEVKVSHQKHPEWVFYDKSSFLIKRVESIVADKYRIVSTYSDFRTTNGVTRPWHITDTYPSPNDYLNDDYKLQTLSMGDSIAPSQFSPPLNRRLIFAGVLPDSMPVKSQVAGDSIIVRVNINGRGLDFELASGANGITIDREVARELGLSAYGQPMQTPNGKPRGFWTKADMYVGDLQLHDMAIYAEPFNYQFNVDTKVVGQLGFDFLNDIALRIDYVNRSLTAMNSKTYDNYTNADTYSLPVRIEDGLPFIESRIGSTTSNHLIFDNAEPFTVLFGGFTIPHGDDVKDTGRHEVHVFPLSQDDVIGYQIQTGVSQIAHFSFGPADYGQWPVISTNIPYNIGDEQVDGIVGLEFIEYYDVTFDYPHARIWLKPNKWFFEKFKKVQ